MMYFRMTYAKLRFTNHTDAAEWWRLSHVSTRHMVGDVQIDEPMTAAQLKRLPARLRALVHTPNVQTEG